MLLFFNEDVKHLHFNMSIPFKRLTKCCRKKEKFIKIRENKDKLIVKCED